MSRHICRSIGRRTLINKGYSKEIAIIYTLRAWAAIACRRVTTYRPYASPMHTHVFVALSRDPSIFLPREHDAYVFRAFRALLLRNQSTAAARLDHRVSLPLSRPLAVSFAMPRKHRPDGRARFRLISIACHWKFPCFYSTGLYLFFIPTLSVSRTK